MLVLKSSFVEAERAELSRFQNATPELLAERTLTRRVDTKFVLNRSFLPPFLNAFSSCAVLVNSDITNAPNYRTVYWDSPENRLLRDHLRGKRPRYKIRLREYLDRKMKYLEVKTAAAAMRTHKNRIEVPYAYSPRAEEVQRHALITSHPTLGALNLVQAITTVFQRITLLGTHCEERLTIDLQPSFKDNKKTISLERLVIIELKQHRRQSRSPMMMALRNSPAEQMSLSKYCTGTALLFQDLRMPTYRAKIRHLRRRLNV